jgi:F420H(2)-dependent quinone reductase
MPERRRSPPLPPRWFIRSAWVVHRGLLRASRGRFGLRPPRPDRWGMLRLRVTGRRSGVERRVILAYLEDGPDLVLMAMNGWAAPPPAWWLNLQAHPEAVVELPSGSVREVIAREAQGEEYSRLWTRWQEVDRNLDGWATRRRTTPLIVLEPRPGRGT